MSKKLIYFTAQYQGCIEVDDGHLFAGGLEDYQDILEDQTHSALFDACETDISLEIISIEVPEPSAEELQFREEWARISFLEQVSKLVD